MATTLLTVIAPACFSAINITWPSRRMAEVLRSYPADRWFGNGRRESDMWNKWPHIDRLVDLGLLEYGPSWKDGETTCRRTALGHNIVVAFEKALSHGGRMVPWPPFDYAEKCGKPVIIINV